MTPTNDCGNPTAATPASIAFEETLARPDHRAQGHQQQPDADQTRPVARRVGMVLALDHLAGRGQRQEEVSVPPGLAEHEPDVEHQGRDGRESQLGRGELRSGPAGGERGEHQGQRGQRRHRGQRGAGSFGVEDRQVVAQRPDQQGQSDDAVGGDHRPRRTRCPGPARPCPVRRRSSGSRSDRPRSRSPPLRAPGIRTAHPPGGRSPPRGARRPARPRRAAPRPRQPRRTAGHGPRLRASASTARIGTIAVQRTRDRITRASLRPAPPWTIAGPAAASRGPEAAVC